MKNSFKVFFKVIVLGCILLSLGISTVFADKTAKNGLLSLKKQMSGNWKSMQAEDIGNGTFGWREFTFADDAWSIGFTMYLDKEKSIPVFRFDATGYYALQGPSTKVPGATDVIFYFEKKYCTLLTSDAKILANFGFTPSPTGEKIDITTSGASFLKSVAAYKQEFDLAKLENAKLMLGMRSNDMSTEDKRPVSLFYPLEKTH